MSKIDNSHDKLFREVWSDTENVRSFLRHYLPPEVLKITDLESLEICKDSFVEKDLREYFSDMLYKVGLAGSPGYVYLLFEHKSYQAKWIHLQLLEYMLKIWRLDLKEEQSSGLPLIIPLVLSHGKQAWPVERTRFSSLMTGPLEQLSAYIPDFSFVLYDLTRFSDEDIRGTIMARVVMLMFKYIFDPALTEKLPGIFALMRELMEKETGLQHLETVLRYLFNTADMSAEGIKNMAEQSLSEKEGDFIMTLAERLHREGMQLGEQRGEQRGEQKGILRNARESVIDILELRFAMVPESFLEMINTIDDISILKILHRKAVTVRSLDEFETIVALILK